MNWLANDSVLEVDPIDVDAARKKGISLRLIDCREEDEYRLCHLEGCELVPLATLSDRRDLERSEEPMVMYCHHGMRSLQAVRFLRARGRRRVFSMRGGIDAWTQLVDDTMPRY